METQEFIFNKTNFHLSSGSYTWKAPSNIALVKYWGKTDPQIPKNTSLSFTLNNCFTETQLVFTPIENKSNPNNFDFEVFLDKKPEDHFKPKIQLFFEKIIQYTPFLHQFKFQIFTHNSFPHSSGIASSASGFAALALCIMSIEKEIDPKMTDDYFFKKAAFLARLGSGSATRSIRGNLILWGKHNEFESSSDLFGSIYSKPIHHMFKDYQDTVLLVDKGQKKVSSSVGHNLMNNHPYAKQRFIQAQHSISKISNAIAIGDLESFITIVESEALTLHAMMMTAHPYFILMHPNTLRIINKIWEYRKAMKSNVCFTLDAGANVHVLYPKRETDTVISFIDNELKQFCQNNQYICDHVGEGAILI